MYIVKGALMYAGIFPQNQDYTKTIITYDPLEVCGGAVVSKSCSNSHRPNRKLKIMMPHPIFL